VGAADKVNKYLQDISLALRLASARGFSKLPSNIIAFQRLAPYLSSKFQGGKGESDGGKLEMCLSRFFPMHVTPHMFYIFTRNFQNRIKFSGGK